jgi:flagella basal body P-ring formation protein FlgA
VIGKLKDQQTSVTIDRRALAALVRRAVPALRPTDANGEVTFVRKKVRSPELDGPCPALLHAVSVGDAIAPEDVVLVACDEQVVAPSLSFDKLHHQLHSKTDLAAGTKLGRTNVLASASIKAGERLRLVATAGPVTVERSVIALQPGGPGGRVFVRDNEGQVSSVAVLAAGDPQAVR